MGKTLNQCVQLKRKCRERRLMAWNGRAGPEACCLSAGKGCRGERGFLPERPWQEERRAACGCSCLPTARPGAALDSVAASGPGFATLQGLHAVRSLESTTLSIELK